MRLMVTGAAGGLGTALKEVATDGHEIVPFTHAELPVERPVDPSHFEDVGADAIVHLAAMTSVDTCEVDPGRAFVVNALGTRNIAAAANRVGALLVYLSTDYIFDGERAEPYHEFDEPHPLSVYGRSKLMGEREVTTLCPDHLIVRTAWVFGSGQDFLSKAVGRLAAGGEVGGIVDQVGSPTYVRDLARGILRLLDARARGTVHLAGPEPAAWHDVLVRAKEIGDLPGTVTEQKMGDLDRPAPRPPNSALTSLVLPAYGFDPLPPLDRPLIEVIDRVRG